MSSIAAEISGICAKYLISSEARYHSSCYNAFVRIVYETDAAPVNNYGRFMKLCFLPVRL